MGVVTRAARTVIGTVLRLPIGPRKQLHLLQQVPRRHRWLWVHRINRVIYLPVKTIEKFCLFDTSDFSQFVLPGDWDSAQRPIQPDLLSNHHYSCLYEILVDGKHFSETAHYRQIAQDLKQRGVSEKRMGRPISSLEDANRYFNRLSEIVDQMRQVGYRNQQELGGSAGSEIGITIDRHGQPLKYHNGHHRFAAAQILKIRSIPVCVQYIHYDTFSRWSERYKGNVVEVLNQGLSDLEADLSHRSD